MNFSNTSSVPLQEQIFEWKDEESDALGWVFIDSVVNGCSFGVLVMNETCSRETVLAQAKQASLAASVCVPQTGGAAAGIRLASPTEVEDRKPILTRFMRAQEALLSNALVLTGETDAEMLAIDDAAHSIGLSGAVHALAKLFSDETGQANFGDTFVHKLRLLSSRVNFCELAQAFGIGQVINCLEEITPLAYKPRVVIDGFGSLGSSLAYFIENLGIGSVVAIRDGLEHISRNDGLPVAEILRSRVEKRRTMQKKKLKNSNLLRYLDEVQLHRFHASADSVLCVEADLIVLCTSERKLSTLEDLDQLLATLSGSGAHFLFPALPLSRSQDLLLDSEEGKKVLDNQDQQCSHVPHWLCVAGRDQMIKSIAVIPFDFDSESARSGAISAVLDSISLPVTRFTQEAYYTFAQKNILMFGHPACAKMARHKGEHPLPFEIVKKENRKLPVEVFNDGERMQHNIETMVSQIKLLIHTLLEDYDCILLALFDDLLAYFVMQQLEIIYLAEDTGERPSKRTAVVVMEGIDKFFRACCNARTALSRDIAHDKANVLDSHELFFEYVKKQRPEEAMEEEEVTEDVMQRLKIPFSAKTITLLSERVVKSNKLLVVLDVVLTQSLEANDQKGQDKAEESPDSTPPPVGSQPDKSTEKHPGELGKALGGILASVAELLELPAILQFGLQAFFVLGGKHFIGKKLDDQMEPSIYEDIASVRNAIKIIRVAKVVTDNEAENVEERVLKKLTELMPFIPFTGDLPKKLISLLMLVAGNAKMMCELLYVYILPALIKKAEDDEKRDLEK